MQKDDSQERFQVETFYKGLTKCFLSKCGRLHLNEFDDSLGYINGKKECIQHGISLADLKF